MARVHLVPAFNITPQVTCRIRLGHDHIHHDSMEPPQQLGCAFSPIRMALSLDPTGDAVDLPASLYTTPLATAGGARAEEEHNV